LEQKKNKRRTGTHVRKSRGGGGGEAVGGEEAEGRERDGTLLQDRSGWTSPPTDLLMGVWRRVAMDSLKFHPNHQTKPFYALGASHL
jgi:hypothetical protein